MTTTLHSPLDGALDAAQRGWRLIRLQPAGKTPAGPWRGRDTHDTATITQWWTGDASPNYGIVADASGLLILDEDTPGSLDRWEAQHGPLPPTFTVTTGKGRHLYYHAGDHRYGNASPFRADGLDVDVRGAGYVVGPGSIHASTGTVYTVVDDRAPAPVPPALHAYLTAPATPPPAPHLEVRETATADRWLTAAIQGALTDLADVVALPEGATDRNGRTWETGALHARACRLVELSNTDPAAYPRAQARADYLGAAPPGHEDRFSHHWDSAVQHVADRPAERPTRPSLAGEYTVPAPRTTTPDPVAGTQPDGDGDGKRPALAVLLRQHVEDRFDVFPAADDERIYAQPKAGGRAELLDGGFIIRAAPDLGRTSGNLSTAATEAAKVLAAIAANHPPRTISLRADHRPDQIVLDLAQPGNGRCVVVTPTGWTIENSPPRDVVFTETGRPLPDPIRGGHIDELRTLLRWPADDPRWPLIMGWLPAALLADLPRPILGFFGPQGSSKTTTGRFVAGLIDPKPAGTLGSGFGKKRGDDETKAVRSYIPAWDNVSTMSEDSADFLSRMVTGDLIERRKLYTDAGVAEVFYRRTSVITGIVAPRGMKPDTLDRFIMVDVQPLAGRRVSEGELAAEWEHVHPRALAGVLDLAVTMLSRLEQARGKNTAGLRMADYAEALWAIHPDLYTAYAENVTTARTDMAANDPFIQTLLRWLNARGGTWEGTAADALEDAEWFRRSQDAQGEAHGWWPANGRTFTVTVTKLSELLRSVGITVTDRRSNGQKLKTFTLNVPPVTGSQTGSQDSACDPLRPSCDPAESTQTHRQPPESTETGSQGPLNPGPLLFSPRRRKEEGNTGEPYKEAPELATLATLPASAAPATATEPPRCDTCGDYLTDTDLTAGRTTHHDCQETTR